MPVRKIPKSFRNVTGISASTKALGDAQFESTLERDFLALLEFSPDVASFEVQPVRIEWRDTAGDLRSYTPDVLVTFKPETGLPPWLCEVKYRADLKKHWETLRPKFRRGIRFARQKHWRFRIVTEKEIRTEYLTNVRFLAPFRPRIISTEAADRLLAQLNRLHHSTPSELAACLASSNGDPAEWLPVIWHLLAQHRIGADLEQSLLMDSPIWSIS